MTDSFADRWGPRFLYALIVLQAVPFFGFPTGLDWPGLHRLNFYKLIVVVLLLGLLSVRLDRVRAALRSRTKLIALCAAFAIWVGLFLGSIAYQSGLRSNLEIFLLYWTPSLLVFAYLLLVYPSSRRQALIPSLAGFYVLALALGYFEWLNWKNPALEPFFLQFREQPYFGLTSQIPRIAGTLGPMGLVEAILIGLPIIAGLSVQAIKKHHWKVFTLLFFLFSMGLVLLVQTFTRHPLLVIPVELLAFVLLSFPKKFNRKFLFAGAGLTLVCLLLGWSLVAAQGHGRFILARYFAMSETDKSIPCPTDPKPATLVNAVARGASRSIVLRSTAYRVSWEIVRDKPWTGVGMGPEGFVHYGKEKTPYLRPEQEGNPITHAHNFYVQMFVSGGVLAGGGFLCLLFLILNKGWSAHRMGRLAGYPLFSPLEIGFLTGVAGVFTSMLLDFKYNLQWSTLILWVLLGTVILILDGTDGQGSTDAAISEKPAETAPESQEIEHPVPKSTLCNPTIGA